MIGKAIVGVEKDRVLLRGAALKIIRQILEHPIHQRAGIRRDWLAPIPPSGYRRLEPIGFGLHQDDWWIFPAKDCKPDVVWPLDVGVVVDESGPEKTMHVGRTRTITAKEARGYASKFSPFMVRTDHAAVWDGEFCSASTVMAWLGGRWVDAVTRFSGSMYAKDGPTPEADCIPCNLSTGVALRQRYEWAVSLGLEHSPSIRFATDPTGIRDVFRIRDLPEGKDRREALLTWVTDHWRQDRHDQDVETYVRKHLRGATAFSWRGMECELLPSRFDLDAKERMIAEREAMKRTGADKRLKV